MYSFSNICKDLTTSGVRNALRSVESFIQVQFSRLEIRNLDVMRQKYKKVKLTAKMNVLKLPVFAC